jgi:glycosyltransferase involved in cell wall biosynthesis
MDGVSAVICTRNRSDSLVRAVRSLLAGDVDAFELIIMDQSDGGETEQALKEMPGTARLRYIRTSANGKGAALNAALRLATSEFVICTDDDCEAPVGWVRAMAKVLSARPEVAVAFCNVVAEPYDTNSGYVPAYERRCDRVLSAVSDARHGLGLGAGLALRRSAVLDLGGFDEAFGPGARFPSGDDWDISLRALIGGWQVYDTSALAIVHHGFRTFAEGRAHAFRDWRAIGALCAKPIRAGHLSVGTVAVSLFAHQALWPPIHSMLHLRRPSGFSRIKGFVNGFCAGMCTPVDSGALVFSSSASKRPVPPR